MNKSNESNSNKWQDRALVTLALGVTEKKTTAVESVSDEDLNSFYQNQLDDAPRARVMYSIANDNGTYQRWIDLVQTIELADKLATEDYEVAQETFFNKPAIDASEIFEKSIEVKKWNYLSRLGSWLRKDRDWTGAFGRQLTIALVAVLAVLLIPQMFQNPTLDELYDQYAMSGSALLPEKSVSFPSVTENNTYSTIHTELAKGIASGFKELAADNLPPEWEVDPTRYSNTEINPDRGVESPYALGRLVALSLVQCTLAKKNKYFKSAAPLIRKLALQHDSFSTQNADSGSDRGYVCNTAAAIVEFI